MMSDKKLHDLMIEHAELTAKKIEINSRINEIAHHLLSAKFDGECVFATQEQIENGEFDTCPTIMAIAMVKDSDPEDAYVTRMRINGGKLYIDVYCYYSGQLYKDINAEDEAPLDWQEVADCLFSLTNIS
jgi:hypothetical protein